MPHPSSTAFFDHFGHLDDPRRDGGHKLFPLDEILFLSFCAVLCGADGFQAIEHFGRAKINYLRRFAPFKRGIPSHDTIGRVFELLDPEAFEDCFLEWVQSVVQLNPGEVVPIDGKALRRSHDHYSNKAALHLVSAFASENGLVLAQVKVDDKSNEITAIPKLLEKLALTGCIITIDAMGCQRKIAAAIIEKEADYVFSLKGNQGGLHEEVIDFFSRPSRYEKVGVTHAETLEKDHGRIEHRVCSVASFEEADLFEIADWVGLKTIIKMERHRLIGQKQESETSYYISSLSAEAEKHLEVIRKHWQIENRLHWVLDVAYDEDGSRIRKGHSSQNMAIVRRITLNALRDAPGKVGVATKRLKAGWDEVYLDKIVQNI
jgi:predicted transposase YbfD/YdcC